MKATIEFQARAQVTWLAKRSKDGGWVAVCPPLNLTVEAETWPELQEVSNEVIQDLLIVLLKEGTIGKFLRDHGWTPTTDIPKKMPRGGVHFDLPTKIEPTRHLHAPA